MKVTVVIPTCNRRTSLFRVLESLTHSAYPIHEVIVIDSSDEVLTAQDLVTFNKLPIQYLTADRSVCIQRNVGIHKATGDWIFLCDDDLEVPAEYIAVLAEHIAEHPAAGAVTGIVLQEQEGKWTGDYAIHSSLDLLGRYIFQSGIWGTINVSSNNLVMRYLKRYYVSKGNHLSRAGWPVITNFSGSYFKTPVYGLGASIVKRAWLQKSPYDEVLDPHGIGDNFGVALGFPAEGIHVVKRAVVYHYRDTVNRLPQSLLYYRRILALTYFLKTTNQHVSKAWFLWSLIGNMMMFLFSGNGKMTITAARVIWNVLFRKNPYLAGKLKGEKKVSPLL